MDVKTPCMEGWGSSPHLNNSLFQRFQHFAAFILSVYISTSVPCFQNSKRFQIETKRLEHSDGLLAQNCEAVLAVRVILVEMPYLQHFTRRHRTHVLRHSQKRYSIRGSSSYFLMTKDPKFISGNILSCG